MSYFGGLLGNAVTNAVVQVTLVVVVGHVLYGSPWPQDWLDVVVFTCLGVVAFGSLGVAFAQVIPNFDSAPAYVNALFLPILLISGTFYSTSHLPGALDAIANALPLKHTIDGLHAGIVTGQGISHQMDAVGVLAEVVPLLSDIDAYLNSFGDSPLSEAALCFGYLAEAVAELRAREA